MAAPKEILKAALALAPAQRVELIDKLLSSLDKPDKEIDELWAEEAESRIKAYEKGKIKVRGLPLGDKFKFRTSYGGKAEIV